MHAGGGELASEGAAEGVHGLDDGTAPAGSWQGWPGVKGVRAQELGLHAVHRERRVPVSSLVRQSFVLGAMFACLSQHLDLRNKEKIIVQYAYLAISAITATTVLDHEAIFQTASIDC